MDPRTYMAGIHFCYIAECVRVATWGYVPELPDGGLGKEIYLCSYHSAMMTRLIEENGNVLEILDHNPKETDGNTP